MYDNSFGERLRSAREKVKLSQIQVMERLHINNKSLSHWELGRAMPPVSVVNQLAELYNVTSDYLLGIDKDRTHDILTAVLKDNTNAIKIIDSVTVKKDGIYNKNGKRISDELCKKIRNSAVVLVDTIESALKE